MLHPSGPEPRVVYLRRRMTLVTAAAVTVLAIVWFSTSLGGGAPDPQLGQAAAAGAMTTTESTVPPLGPTTADATAPSSSAPSSPAQASTTGQRPTPVVPSVNGPQGVACSDSAITVEAQAAAPAYAVGAQPVFRLLIANTGKAACTADLSAPLQELIVYSADGRTRLWSSNDCFPGTAAETHPLAPAEQAVYSVQWSGTTSTEGCSAPRKPAAAGHYVVMGVLGGRQSQPAPFTLN